MKAEEVFEALLPTYQAAIAEFKEVYTKARLRSFIIPSSQAIELVPSIANMKGLDRCFSCKRKTEWLQVSRERIVAFCESHHPRPRVHNER